MIVALFFQPTESTAQTALELFERVDVSPELAMLANNPDRFEETRIAALKRLARGAGVLSPDRIERNRSESIKRRIASQIRLVATLDIDGDGQVTLDEGKAASEEAEHLGKRHTKFLEVIDKDSDGLLSRTEILTYATEYAETYPELATESGADFLRFDMNGDGTVSVTDIQDYVRTIRTLLENQPGAEPVCVLPPRELFQSYTLFAINGAKERDEDGRPVVVFSKERGAPATPGLVLSRDPVVLRFEGDASLATTLIVTEDVLEVVGLPSEKVIRVPKSPCTTYSGEARSSHLAYLNRGRIVHALGPMWSSAYLEDASHVFW